jgi:hypothetical protein
MLAQMIAKPMLEVKQIIPAIDMKSVISTMNEIFKQYIVCKCTASQNQSRVEYKCTIEEVVSMLPDPEKELITVKYMQSEYIKDFQVYNFLLEEPIGKSTYQKIRASAFYKLIIAFEEKGILKISQH